jgi:hypothetical protein
MGGQSAGLWLLRQTSLGPSQLADDWLLIAARVSSFPGSRIGTVGANLQRSLSVFSGMKPEMGIVLIGLALIGLIFAVLVTLGQPF